MRTAIVTAVFVAALVALSAPAMARNKGWNNDWTPPWEQCQGWNCDDSDWQNGWRPGWNDDWNDNDWDDGNGWDNDNDWDDGNGWKHGKSRLVSKDVIARQLQDNGYRRIYDIRLDDDGVVYIVRAWDWRDRLTKLFFDARNGRFISKVFAD